MDKLRFFPFIFYYRRVPPLTQGNGGVVPHHGVQHNEPTTTMQ
jgi:hypothetical protein